MAPSLLIIETLGSQIILTNDRFCAWTFPELDLPQSLLSVTFPSTLN